MKKLTCLLSKCRFGLASLATLCVLLIGGGLSATPAAGQSKDAVITGKVTGKATKEPLAGVIVFIDETSYNTTTDSQGNYSLIFTPTEGMTISFYFLGMEDEKVVYTGQKEIDVAMIEASESLDDVVVTGYGNIRKEGFTGNTTRITKDEIVKVSQKNVIDAIQVFDPSFRITENIAMGSNPNALPEFYIRGQTAVNLDAGVDISKQNLTSNNNLPIFILDGFEVSVEKIYDMDPMRINSVTLLKDAAATALYGSRAANGVVVIESRAPESGKLRVSYNLTTGVEAPDLSGYNLMNAREKLDAEVAAGYYDISDFDPVNDPLNALQDYNKYIKLRNDVLRGVNTDWMAKAVRTAFHHQHSLYIDGGEKDIRWGVELKYNGSDGVMKGTNRNTYGAGLTLDYRFGKFQILNRAYFDVMNSNEMPYQDFSSYSHLQPYATPIDPLTGKYIRNIPSLYSDGIVANPLYEAEYMMSYDRDSYNDFSNNLQLNFFATKDLTAKVQFSVDKKFSKTKLFIDPASAKFAQESDPSQIGTLDLDEGESFSYSLNALLMYNKSIKKNYINVTAGAELRETNVESLASSYRGFSNGALSSVNNAMAIDAKPVRSSNKSRLASFLMMANYSYDDIYLVDASVRLDGSSEFGKDKKTAPFWAAGLGLNIHNYAFLKGNPVISRIKLRATYGQVGKVNFPVYAARTTYITTSTQDWYMTGLGNVLQYLGNDDLGWEKTNTIDAGFDFGMFKDRFLLKFTWYDKQTNGMITTVSLPSSSGFSGYMANIGKVENKGFEIDLRYNVIRTEDWDLTVFGNMSHNKNRIMEISDALANYNKLVDKLYADYSIGRDNAKYSQINSKFVEGGSTTSIFAMKSLGINPANGKELYLRPDGTVTYEWNAADQVIVGNTEPKARGAFGLNARWKNFSIFTSFIYHFGGQQYNSTLVNYVENVNLMKQNADRRVSLLRWRNPGDVTCLKDIAESAYVTRPTSRFVQDENTLQFNSLSLSYDFNPQLLKKVHISMLRLTASMEDVGYWSSIRRERGLAYPYSRVFNFTLNVTF